MSIVPGAAFMTDTGLTLGNFRPHGEGKHVFKSWEKSEDGRSFLVESIFWRDILPELDRLKATAAKKSQNPKAIALSRQWPARIRASAKKEPIQLAENGSLPAGLVVDFDFVIVPTNQVTTFQTGITYYIQSYFAASTFTFNPGCVLKYKNQAYLLCYSGVNFSSTLQTPVFTSRNDDGWGSKIAGVSGESDSDGNPANHIAASAITFYYPTGNTEVKNARFRWVGYGLEYAVSNASSTHIVKDSLFEQITSSGSAAVRLAYMPNYAFTFNNVQKCNVTTAVSGTASYLGAVTDAPFCLQKNFFGHSNRDLFDDVGQWMDATPDPMGAAGPNHFVELVNGVVAVYSKSSGALLESQQAKLLFYSTGGGTMSDPRILYDSGLQRWIAVMLDRTSGDVRLAVSTNSSPTGLTSWNKFPLSMGESGWFPDFPTLGVDGNGIYVALRLVKMDNPSVPVDPFDPDHWKYKIVPIRRPDNNASISSSHIRQPLTINSDTGYNISWIYPAINFDSTTSSSIAWFIAKGQSSSNCPVFEYGRLQWTQDVNGVWQADFLEKPWNKFVTGSKKVYDLDNSLDFSLPQKTTTGGTLTPDDLAGSRVQSAVVRNGYLWTCHHVGLDGGDDDYDGTGGGVDRLAVAWYRIKIKTDNTLSLASGDGALYDTLRDTSASTPYHYVFPSMTVNASGDLMVAFSAARSSEYIGAMYWGGRSSGSTLAAPALLQAGRDYYNAVRFGDYSACYIDPSDGTFWTIQECAEMRDEGSPSPGPWYGLWFSNIKINP